MHTHGVTTGTITGTFLTILFSIPMSSVLTTIVLAVIGASTSFVVSLVWKYCLKEYNDWKTKKDAK